MIIKLLVTDLDGTLLRSDNTISDYTINIFEQLKRDGHLICFASARGYSMTRYINLIKPQVTIENGGSKINYKGEIIYRNMLSEDDVNTIIKTSREFTNGKVNICIENDEAYFCNYIPNDAERRSISRYSDLKSFKGPAYDVSVELEHGEWASEIQKSCNNCKVQSFSGMVWRQFFANGTSKVNALKKIMSHIGIDLDDVIVFGDDVNDLGMLKIAGTAIAVSNAIDEVKAVANHITESNNEDGVAKFLEKMLLN